jgi:hypothetical protein
MVNVPSREAQARLVGVTSELYAGHFRLAADRLNDPVKAYEIIERARGRTAADVLRAFGKPFRRVRSLREGRRRQENSDRNDTDAADQSNAVARHDSFPRFAGAPQNLLQPQGLRIKPARRLSAAPGLPLGAETFGYRVV